MNFYFLMLLFLGAGWFIQYRLRSKFAKYSQTPLASNLSGAEAARKMLDDNQIYDVNIVTVDGQLSDNYNPGNKTVNLSHDVYYGRNAAAVAVATHECGHAVQHARAYTWLSFRSALVPALSLTSNIIPWVLIAGVLLINTFPLLLGIGILLFALTTIFSFITLPVEFDASRRALAWISAKGIVTPREYEMSKDALRWAALTYVVAALSSLATLLYYIGIFNNRRD